MGSTPEYLLGFSTGMQFVLLAMERQAKTLPRDPKQRVEGWIRDYHTMALEFRRRVSDRATDAAEPGPVERLVE